MAAYNLVNGIHCTQSEYLLEKILKQEWGFDGIIMSDWESTYDAVAAANAGLDLEMPTGKLMNRQSLEPAIKAGLVKESTIDEKVHRILRTIIAAGFLDRPQTDPSIPRNDPQNDKVALKGALESVVLLKNDEKALPLNREKIKSVAVLGPNAHPAVYGGGGSAFVHTYHSTSIADGIREAAGNVEVRLPTGYLDLDGPAKMEFFGNRELEGAPLHTSPDAPYLLLVAHGAGPGTCRRARLFRCGPSQRFGLPMTGEYTFCAHVGEGTRVFVDSGARVFVDGSLVMTLGTRGLPE